jgi:hypothetical protein
MEMSKIQTPKFPLVAELNDLANCLNRIGERPLKLIADKVYKKFKETEWDVPKWSFSSSNGILRDKKLLSNADDAFQFSIANGQSKQDFHAHKEIFEIYVSYSKMEISYIRDQTKETIHISEGVIIVPPQVLHKVKLHGITFVFQASIKGGKVHDDKKVKVFKF